MHRYLIRRILQALIVVVMVSLVCGDGPLTLVGRESNSNPPEQLLAL